jgi:bifunctional DNA-binding transcriptional regulator/antitoxin component of YhaV-PrlF toxin-antitoxin module
MNILGTTKLAKGGKITVIKDIQNKMKLKEGDIIVFCETDAGDIIIRKGSVCMLPTSE